MSDSKLWRSDVYVVVTFPQEDVVRVCDRETGKAVETFINSARIRALVEKWREYAAYTCMTEFGQGKEIALKSCADELAALIDDR